MIAMLPMLVAAAVSEAPLTTVAERSGWTETGRYDEVIQLCSSFQKAYPTKVRCRSFGTTPEGRPMLSLVASADGTLEPQDARKKGSRAHPCRRPPMASLPPISARWSMRGLARNTATGTTSPHCS